MEKKSKAPPRKTIKAKGALPVPKVAPQRSTKVWYKRRGFMMIFGVLAVGLAAGAVLIALKVTNNINTKKDNARTITLFERKVRLLQQPFEQVLGDMNTAPGEFAAGTFPAEEYKKLTATWLEEFRKLDSGLRERKIPAGLPGLAQARAHLVQGTVIYIDAAKVFQLSAGLTDPALRDEAIQQGRNLVAHATSVYGIGQRRLVGLKKQFGVKGAEEEVKLLGPIPLPEEEVPPPPPPPPVDAAPGSGGSP